MPKPAKLDKASLTEMATDLEQVASGAQPVYVQFNPETLKVTYANQVSPDEKGSQVGTAAMQHIGKGTTKLAVQLWFDVNHPTAGDAPPRDVRELTRPVIYFITPQKDPKEPATFINRPVRFQWGAFLFVGVMESLDESLEYFSSDGLPLRSALNFSLTQQEIVAFRSAPAGRLPKAAGVSDRRPAGTVAFTTAPAGATVQSLAAPGVSWQAIATANGIENPRLLAPGQLLNVQLSTR